jgi:hypothetical protein
MPLLSRRRLWVSVSLAGLLFAALLVFVLTRGEDLRTRLAQVSVGMRREQVERILGRPEIALNRARPGTGKLLVWVDQLWQVEVVVDGEGRVVSTAWTRSNSLYWGTVGRLIDLPK